MSLYQTELSKAGTFKYLPWSADGVIAVIADHSGVRYLYASEGIPLPESSEAKYIRAELSLDQIFQLEKSVVSIPEVISKQKSVYSVTDKSPVSIPVWANCPAGYTEQVPREFDRWDGSLWVTDLELRNKTLKARKIQEINIACELSLAVLRTEYPDSEVISWSKQEIEARKALVDPEYPTPLVDLISTARGLDRQVLIEKIILKADQYAYAVGLAIGKRQALEDQIKAIKIGEESKLDQIKF